MNKIILVLQHIECEPLGILEGILSRADIAYRYLRLYKDDYSNIDIGCYQGLIILGGPMNVDEVERYPFLGWELDLIRRADRRNLPILGICLGAQLISKAFGAEVKKGVAREIGWHKVQRAESAAADSLFSGLGEEFGVFQLHADTFGIPQNARCLAGSAECQNQAFCIKDNIYGLQFHLELNEKMLRDWLEVYKDDIEAGEQENILTHSEEKLKELNACCTEFFEEFIKKIP